MISLNKQSVKKVIQFVDDLYLSANLGLFEEKPAIRALLFHTVFSNICEIEKDLILPQQRLTLDDYRLIFEYFLEPFLASMDDALQER